MKISKEAIEAGARAFWDEYARGMLVLSWSLLTDEQRERLQRCWGESVNIASPYLQDCKSSPQTVQSPPATATHVAIDDAEVERVGKAIYDEWQTHCTVGVPAGPYTPDPRHDASRNARWAARAAIRAIREGGQRWGVWCQDPDTNSPGGWSEIAMGVVSTSDKALADSVAANKNRGLGCVCYEVRPYDAEGEAERKEAERIARIGHDAFQKALGRAVPVQFDSMTKKWQDAVVAQAEAISAAIRATKGGK